MYQENNDLRVLREQSNRERKKENESSAESIRIQREKANKEEKVFKLFNSAGIVLTKQETKELAKCRITTLKTFVPKMKQRKETVLEIPIGESYAKFLWKLYKRIRTKIPKIEQTGRYYIQVSGREIWCMKSMATKLYGELRKGEN